MIIISRNCLVPDCGGADHKWEIERPTLREFRFIQETVGLDPDDFETALNAGGTIQSIDALLALLTILHRRDGLQVPFDDVDADLAHLEFVADPVAEPEEKPTGQPPTSPLPRDPEPAPPSGGSTGEGSEPKSSTTEPGSGGITASPSSPSTT